MSEARDLYYKMSDAMKIKQKHENKLNKIFSDLNKAMEEIREYIPDANLYFNGSGCLSVNLHALKYEGENNYNIWYDSNIWSKDINYADCGGY